MQFCCVGYLRNIKPFSGTDNIGGILELKVARKADIISIPDPANGTVYGSIVFESGKGFVTWSATIETGRAKTDSKLSREGTIKGNRLNFIIPKDRADIRYMFEQAEDDELIVVYQESGAKQKLFGLLESPVRFSVNHDGGGKVEDGNFYECQFFYDGPDNIFFYEGSVTGQPPGAAPVLVRVNGSIVATALPGQIIDFTTDFTFDFNIVGT